MKSKSGWVLTRKPMHPGFVTPVNLAVIVPSRKVTNKVADDIVREAHLKEYGRLWPTKVVWRAPKDPLVLELKTPLCTYQLTRIEVYG